jgi:hypothetical protein
MIDGDVFTTTNPDLDESVLTRAEELYELLVNWHGDAENTVSDVLAYLMHIVELTGGDWDEHVERGRFHYEAEREGL